MRKLQKHADKAEREVCKTAQELQKAETLCQMVTTAHRAAFLEYKARAQELKEAIAPDADVP